MIAAILLLVLACVPLAAAKLNVEVLGRENHLPFVNNILEDRHGLIWLATANGLYTYDGVRFLRIGVEQGLPNATVWNLAEATDGTLWIGTAKGLAYLRDGRITTLNDRQIFKMAADKLNQVYVHIPSGVAVIRWIEGKPRLDPLTSLRPRGNMHVDAQNLLWFGAETQLYSINPADFAGQFPAHFPIPTSKIGAEAGLPAGNALHIVTTAPDGTIYARNSVGGWVRPAGQTRFVKRGIHYAQNDFGTVSIVDRRGRHWAVRTGMLFRDWDGAREQPWKEESGVHCVTEDHTGALWVCLEVGIARITEPDSWEWYPEADTARNPQRDRKGVLRSGGAKYYRLDETSNRFVPEVGARAFDMVPGILVAADGSEWISSYAGLFRIAPDGRRIGPYAVSGPGSLKRPSCIGQLGAEIWAGSQDGIYRGLPEGGDWVFRQVRLPAGMSDGIQHIEQDGENSLIIAGTGGLFRWDGEVLSTYAQNAGLLNSALTDVTVSKGPSDPSVDYWVGYLFQNGFSRVRIREGKLTAQHFEEGEGYGSDRPMFFRTDARGWLWRGTDQGVFIADPKRGVSAKDWVHLSRSDGLLSDLTHTESFYADRDGSVWFDTAAGLAHFRVPEDLFDLAKRPPRAAIAAIAWDGSLARPAALADRVLPAGDHTLQATLGVRPDRYTGTPIVEARLLPDAPDWRPAEDGQIAFRDLNGGTYTLEARALNRAGAASETVRQAFTVAVPWHRGKPVGGLALLLACGGAAFLWIRAKRAPATVDEETAYSRIMDAFLTARNLTTETQRTAFLAALSERSPTVSRRVEAMLRNSLDADGANLEGVLLEGRYQVVSRLAEGGFATVYRATDRRLASRPTAIKVLHGWNASDPARTEWLNRQFQQEIAAMARLRHPGIASVIDVGSTPDGRYFLAMEFLEGETLRDVIASNGKLDPARAFAIARQLGGALAAAHAAQILHQDAKPENVIVRRNRDGVEEAVLIDFGIASVKDFDLPSRTLIEVAGSPAYMAPEQYFGQGSPASDVYSLAVVIFEMLVGESPRALGARNPFEVRRCMGAELLTVAIPSDAKDVILRCVAFDPAQRPSLEDLLRILM